MPFAGDEALARAAVAGDGAAFAQLYDRHERRAFNLAYRITGTPEDAADATQEAFLKVLARLPRMAGRKLDFGAYLLTAVRHASYDVIAAARRAEPTQDLPDAARPVGAAAAPPPDEDPGRRVLLAAQQEEIRAANATLPPRQREALALRELEDLSYDEIAALMGMNRNSVAQLISRARIGLRDALRRTALLSIVPATPACERALALVAQRDDGEIAHDAWLDAHLRDCETCALAREAMAEAGASYRAWAPLAVVEVLRRETIAKAGEHLGHDWGEHALRAPLRPLSGARLRRDGLVAVAVAVVVLLVVLAPHAQDGMVSALGEPPAAVVVVQKPARALPKPARTKAPRTRWHPARHVAPARSSVPPVRSTAAPAPRASRSSTPAALAVTMRRKSTSSSPDKPAPAEVVAPVPAGQTDTGVGVGVGVTPPPPLPPDRPPPMPPVGSTTFTASPPPPPSTPPRRTPPRRPSGGSSGVPVP